MMSLENIIVLILLGFLLFLAYYVGKTNKKILWWRVYAKLKNPENMVVGVVVGLIVLAITGTVSNMLLASFMILLTIFLMFTFSLDKKIKKCPKCNKPL